MGLPEVRATLDVLLVGGPVTQERVAALSDLEREAADLVRDAWRRIPAPTRAQVMQQADQIFLDSLDVDFSRLALIAAADPEAPVRLAAIIALSESDSRETANEFLRMVTDSDDDVREAALDGLGRFVLMGELGTIAESLSNSITTALRKAATASAEPEEVRAAAIESLGYSSLEWVGPLLMEAYDSDSREMRLAAVIAMGHSADDQWLDYLFDQILSDDPEFRVEALEACGEIASEDALDQVAAALEGEDPEVVFAALAALGEIGGADAVQLINTFAEHADEEYEDAITLAREIAKEARRTPGGLDDDL